jgi:anaerobic magnesium-protoporphyrin IX monomethyl ester cyclase
MAPPGSLRRRRAVDAPMKRVLLVNPFYPITETPSPPLGLAYLAGALEAAGAECRLLDLVVMPHEGPAPLTGALAAFRPAMVGVTAVTMNVHAALAVVRAVKAADPGIVTLLGGPHATFRAAETLAETPELDLVVLGEGEATLVELAAAGADPRAWSAIRGIAFRGPTGTVTTPPRPLIPHLDALPLPARHRVPLGRYRTLGMPVSITTSRGCPFHCIFCVGRRMVGAKPRFRSPCLVVDEMQHLVDLGFPQVNLADDLFTFRPEHCRGVCAEIRRRGLRVRWSSFARVDTVSVDLLREMREAGCHAVSFGVESGDPGILKTIRKGITLEQVEAAVGMCAEAGMEAHASFILGLPGETPATLEATLAFAERMRAQGLNYGFHLLCPFPGTEIRENTAAYDLRIRNHDWAAYDANRALCDTAAVDRDTLDAAVDRWESRFKAFLEDIITRLGEGRATAEEAAQVRNMERTVFLYEMMKAEVLESLGWQVHGTPDDGLADLAAKAAPMLPGTRTAAQLRPHLERALAAGGLLRETENGRVRWSWRDYL